MNNEFCTYEQSLELKKMGFNEPCLACYNKEGKLLAGTTLGYEATDWVYKQEDMDDVHAQCIAPLKSQVFKWFRKEYNLCYDIFDITIQSGEYDGYRWKYGIYKPQHEDYVYIDNSLLGFIAYEEAESFCIDKIIELVKKKPLNLEWKDASKEEMKSKRLKGYDKYSF
jgi:hypothetical protein